MVVVARQLAVAKGQLAVGARSEALVAVVAERAGARVPEEGWAVAEAGKRLQQYTLLSVLQRDL